MNITAEAAWFIALLIGPAYSIKYFGLTRTLWAAFAVSTLVCLWIVPLAILREFHRHNDFLSVPGLVVPAIFAVEGAISGMACWTVWKRKHSARLWAIAASLTYFVAPLLTVSSRIHLSRPVRGCSVAVMVVGVAGLIVFSRRTINYPSIDQEQLET